MSDTNNVSSKEVAAAVAHVAACMASAEGMTEDEAFRFLAHWLDAGEARALVMLLMIPRIRCRSCQRCVRVASARVSGAHCLPCAVALRNEIPDEVTP